MSKKVECEWLESGADRENINKHVCTEGVKKYGNQPTDPPVG